MQSALCTLCSVTAGCAFRFCVLRFCVLCSHLALRSPSQPALAPAARVAAFSYCVPSSRRPTRGEMQASEPRGVPSLKLPMKRESCYNLEQIYAIAAIISQGCTYKEKVLVDVRKRVMMHSWYIQLSRASDPANVALLTPLTYDMLLEFARNAAVTGTAFSADAKRRARMTGRRWARATCYPRRLGCAASHAARATTRGSAPSTPRGSTPPLRVGTPRRRRGRGHAPPRVTRLENNLLYVVNTKITLI